MIEEDEYDFYNIIQKYSLNAGQSRVDEDIY
jgi:hypothetical protein